MSEFNYDIKQVVDFLGGGIDENIVFNLIGVFVKSVNDEMPLLKEAVDQLNKPQIHKVGHKLKGSSANLGFESFRKLCESLEQNARHDFEYDYAGTLAKLLVEKESIEKWYESEKANNGM